MTTWTPNNPVNPTTYDEPNRPGSAYNPPVVIQVPGPAGAPGAPGGPGAQGPQGPQGPPGPLNQAITVSTTEPTGRNYGDIWINPDGNPTGTILGTVDTITDLFLFGVNE